MALVSAMAAGCGSDSSAGGPACTEGERSQPDSPSDPCPQVGTGCAAEGKKAVAMCLADGTWDQCLCDPNSGGGLGAGACGNGVREGAEQCDGADLGGASCNTLGYAGGTLVCDAASCTYDQSLCTSQSTGGSGGGGNGG